MSKRTSKGMQVKLTKVKSDHNNLRTDEVVGECDSLPEVGTGFSMYGEPLDSKLNVRLIRTSEITQCTLTSPISYLFHTLNSVYRLDILE